jgi:AcrR family transcriptional regulator
MEKSTSVRLIEAAYAVLAREGAKGATVRAIEGEAGVPHGSVRHHFGGRAGLILALVDDLIADDHARLPEGPDAMTARMLGPDRNRTIARYELFLLATRNETLRARVVDARDQLVALAGDAGMGAPAARGLVAAVDGFILDGLLRRDTGPDISTLAALAAPTGSEGFGNLPPR